MPHLLADISAHGFGHVSQTAPVVNELARLIPELRVTLRTIAPRHILMQCFQCDFQHIPVAFDFGMRMANAVDVEVERSAVAYRALHANWEEKVEHEARAMSMLKPDLLLANAPCLSLAAAHVAGIRAVAMCSLNWADIYRHYCAEDAACGTIYGQMLAAYNSADCFLRVQPALPMSDLANTINISPIAQVGHSQRLHIAEKLQLREDEKLVMVAMGGMEFRLPVEQWPNFLGIRWLVPLAWKVERSDMAAWESLGLPFSDVLASCDAVLTKPGYGLFVEAACAGVPVLYIERHDWPEEPYLTNWLRQHGVCIEVERDRLRTGQLEDVLAQACHMPRPSCYCSTGANEAAHYLMENYF